MQSLHKKVVVITGAASGIGRALALECAGRGARLFLADIDEAGLADVCARVQAAGTQCQTKRVDAGSEADIFALAQACAERYGGADVLINNAGVTLVSSVDKLQTPDAQWLMNINFWGVVHGCRAFLPQMRKRPEAMLVNISSIFAMVSVPSQSMYNAAKAAVRGFSDSLREELRSSSVAVLCVHPGGIRTNIANSARMADLSLLEMSAQQMRDGFAQNARTTPEQAATAIVRAIERGQTRLMIGMDARILDWVYRIVPARASGWITALGRRRQQATLRQLREKAGHPQAVNSRNQIQPAIKVIKALLLTTYALAIISLFTALPFGAGPLLQGATLILLGIHLLELLVVFKHVKLYRGALAASVALTMLYGLLHWKPLADAQAHKSPS